MNVQKKHAVALANFIADYLDHGYYPVDDTVDESGMISRILAFAHHHQLFHEADIDNWIDKIDSLSHEERKGRLDLTSAEAGAIMDMMTESLGEIEDDYNPLRRYIDRFVIDADNLEADQGK